jgi:predicted short-subunit dehydrogenase-like oxidoreductase (DUF2520 family)
MDIAVIGAGRVGTAVAAALRSAGHDIVAVSGREATSARAARYLPDVPVLDAVRASAKASTVIVTVPDDAIASVVADVAAGGGFRAGGWAVHMSGATPLSVLDPAREAGAGRLAVHPLQTFPTVEDALRRLRGSAIAVTADDETGETVGTSLGRDLGGSPFLLAEDARALYHAAAVFASNYVVTVTAMAAHLFALAGVADPGAVMGPLQRATLENVERLGPAAALTGPAVRGDAGTIQRNLAAIAAASPGSVAPYVALCRAALRLSVDSGRLTAEAAAPVGEVLDAWM